MPSSSVPPATIPEEASSSGQDYFLYENGGGEDVSSELLADEPSPPNNNNKIPPPSLLSHLTRHESEAERNLLQALDRQRSQRGSMSRDSAGGRRKLLVSKLSTLNEHQQQLAQDKQPLATQTHYLQSLEDSSSVAGQSFRNLNIEEEKDRRRNFATMDPSQRIVMAGSVLLAAAGKSHRKLPTSTSSRRLESTPEETGGGGAVVARGHVTSDDDDLEAPTNNAAGGKQWMGRRLLVAVPNQARQGVQAALEATTEEWRSLQDFFQPQRGTLFRQLLWSLLLAIPSGATAYVLFYWTDNPPTGKCNAENLEACTGIHASASWWILFLGVRQVITWWLGKFLDMFWIDWVLMQHPVVCRFMGPRLSLMLVQSKGWPSHLFAWMVWNALILYGPGSFNQNWLYFQDSIALFTDANPGGLITTNEWYRTVLIAGIVVSTAVSVKRHVMGLHLGARLYARFNDRLKAVTKNIALIAELALWARRKRDKGATYPEFLKKQARFAAEAAVAAGTLTSQNKQSRTSNGIRSSLIMMSESKDDEDFVLPPNIDPVTANLIKGEPIDYNELLDHWEEPIRAGSRQVSGNQVIEFRQAFNVATKPYFFSSAFGPVETREQCVISADHLYLRLLKLMGAQSDDDSLDLNDLLDWMFKKQIREDKTMDSQTKARIADFKTLFPSDIDGRLGFMEFLKAIDEVYKEVRLLENAVNNASDIDRSYERMVNWVFYFLLLCVILAISGTDVLAVIVAVSSFIVAFSFMIGPGTAQIFEGVLLVLGRQPYDIGDRVAISNAEDLPSFDGSSHWMVEGIDLITTKARLTGTGEIATFSNGSIARCRLMNMNRSPLAIVYVRVKFGTDIPYATILIFRSAVQKFVEEKPAEWHKFIGFRTTVIESQENFVEYAIVVQHRNSWQNIVPILDSKAALACFCVELQKQLDCRYKAPSKPIEITMHGRGSSKSMMRSLLVGGGGSMGSRNNSSEALLSKQDSTSEDDSRMMQMMPPGMMYEDDANGSEEDEDEFDFGDGMPKVESVDQLMEAAKLFAPASSFTKDP